MTASRHRWLSLASNALFAFAIFIFVGYLVIFFIYALALLRFPYDYDQGEGFELNDSILFSRGEWPYRDNEAFPFYASNYGPVFHLLALPLFPIFGPTLAAGRFLSFLATIAIGVTVAVVVGRRTRDRPIAALSGLMVFASSFIYHVGPLYRQHVTMVLFELLAVVAISGYDHPKHGRRNIVLSMVFLLLAGYTKQLSAATAAAALAFLFLRSPKKAIASGLGLAATAGVVFLWMNAATGGQWFVNSITANANAYDYRQAVTLYGQFFSLHFLIAGLAIGYFFYELYWDRLSAYSIWFAFALANAALAGKWGAGESYFVTAVTAACITSGFALGRLSRSQIARGGVPNPPYSAGFGNPAGANGDLRRLKAALPARWPRAAALLGVLIPLLYLAQAWAVRHLPTDGPVFGALADAIGVGRGASVYAGYPYFDSIGYTQAGHLPTEADASQGDRIVAHAASDGRPALTEEASFALRAGKPVVTNPTQLLNLWNNGALDPAALIAMIDEQAFSVVVLRAQFYPPPVLQAIGARYEPIDDVWMNGFQYRILGPRTDVGAGCDEARLYAMKHWLEEAAAGGAIRIASRDTAPEGWSGATGATEFQHVTGGERVYRLWIAPIDWEGTRPASGGAAFIGRNTCFRFFDDAGAEPEVRLLARRLFDIRP